MGSDTARPRIGVTGPDRGGLAQWVFTWLAVRRAGGQAIRIRPGRPRSARELDGLVIGGGADVGPRSDEPPTARHLRFRWRDLASYLIAPLVLLLRVLLRRPKPSGQDPRRDALEYELIAEAERLGLPVLGICRGGQLLNAAAGGSLHKDLSFYVESPRLWTVMPIKPVQIDKRSRLHELLGDCCRVNSLHRQAVDRTGTGLRVVARDDYGIVQAIEHPERSFWIGVQWHPEFLPHLPEQRRLFGGLVRAARIQPSAASASSKRSTSAAVL